MCFLKNIRVTSLLSSLNSGKMTQMVSSHLTSNIRCQVFLLPCNSLSGTFHRFLTKFKYDM